MARRVSVRAIVLHKGMLLCVRLKPYTEMAAGMPETWCLPGGKLEEGEALIPGTKREMVEETGIVPEVGNLLYIQQFMFKDQDYLEFFFHVTNTEAFLHIDLTKTSHGAEEIEEIAFVDPAKTAILPKFLMTEPLEQKVMSAAPTIVSFQD